MFENCKIFVEVKTSEKSNRDYTVVTIILPNGVQINSFDKELRFALLQECYKSLNN